MSFMPSITYTKDDKEIRSDLLTKMLEDRVIMLMTPVNNISMTSVISQLLYLNVKDPSSPIHLYISSPGGSVLDGYGIIDTMNLIEAPVYTYTIGLAASMGALIFLNGDKRYMLPHSELMLHQPLGGVSGQASDIEITANRIIKMKKDINEMIATRCNLDIEKVEKFIDRDRYFNATEAIEYGLADEIIKKIEVKKMK
ncbi:ATP-dependent Clp protease proteolytic subunit (plasmid) [Arcobacter cryaerophilus gv. pseudocryaerophilus]|uniref:ATP-dependent Clp protease proteolytic subunit n=3 Tax=Arcobacteraceae TaxID=2808963 RepID=A0AA96IJZ5_9BACT|nr:ATP-dependent Clp protease proteolytic subunit [Arcobacter sp. AZ-2023]WNL37302.1 ATP-dependent Clp protease proteolytic subunit [Arcobacter sp. AZ-2023]WPD13018.1 ATP-dependent Clp protease proteolytic subunit [Arcobacter sp. DSM 115960]